MKRRAFLQALLGAPLTPFAPVVLPTNKFTVDPSAHYIIIGGGGGGGSGGIASSTHGGGGGSGRHIKWDGTPLKVSVGTQKEQG